MTNLIKYNFSDFDKVILYTNLDEKYKVYKKDIVETEMSLENMPMPGPNDDPGSAFTLAAQQAFKNISTTYDSYKAELSKSMDFHTFLIKASNSRSSFAVDSNAEFVHDFAKELLKIVNRQEDLEKNSTLPLFFHRLRNLVTIGIWSFKTDSEYGKALATEIDAYPTMQLSTQLKACIFRGLGRKLFEPTTEVKLDNMQDQFNNSLSDEDFKLLLKEAIFSRKEVEWGMNGTNKLAFFQRLTPERKQLFIKELLQTKNWQDHLLEMTRKSGHHERQVLDDLVTDEVVAKFQSDNPEQRNQWIHAVDLHLNGCEDFFADLIIKTMISYAKVGNFIGCVNIYNQLDEEKKKICRDYWKTHSTSALLHNSPHVKFEIACK